MILYLSLILCLMVILMLIFNLSLKVNNLEKEKLVSFECGFNSFNLSRVSFSIQFFKILLAFLLFDLEIIIVMPLVYVVYMAWVNEVVIFLVLVLLIYGLVYEFIEGSLEWLK